MQNYFSKIFTALSELVNVIFGGYQHETICARVFREYQGTILHRFIDWLFRDKKHCRSAYLANALRKNQNNIIKGCC